jgi:DNA-binding CsgD family transcriptional regulator
MSQAIPAVWVAQQDGAVSSQNIPARRLLGEGRGTTCWELVGGLAKAEDLPCRNGCVRKLLRSGINHTGHTCIKIGGQRHHLSCIPIAGEVLCMLNHATGEAPESWQALTSREVDVLELLAEGETSASAADVLGLSESTVRTHVEKMLTKLDASNRAALVAKGFRLGYLE